MLFCIVGTSRCGSTLLRQLLDMHPDVNVLNETQWLPRMFEFFGTSSVATRRLLSVAKKTEWDNGKNLIDVNLDLVGITREAFFDAFNEATRGRPMMTIREFSDLFASLVFKDQKKRFWADKTPDYGFHMGVLQIIWPACKFIHITRLGHMTALSMSRHSGCQLMVSAGYDNWCSLSYDGLYKNYQTLEHPLDKYIGTWRRRMVRIRNEAQRLRPGIYREIQFENLVQRPAEILTQITSYIGLDAPIGWLQWAENEIIAEKAHPQRLPGVVDKLNSEDLRALSQDRSLSYLLPAQEYLAREPQHLLEIAGNELSRQNYDAARSALYQLLGALDKNIDHPMALEAHVVLVRIFLEMGRHRDAAHWMGQALEIWPEDASLFAWNAKIQDTRHGGGGLVQV